MKYLLLIPIFIFSFLNTNNQKEQIEIENRQLKMELAKVKTDSAKLQNTIFALERKIKTEVTQPLEKLYVTSFFGRRFHPIIKRWRHHDGVDFKAWYNTKCFAVQDGTITKIYRDPRVGYGRAIELTSKLDSSRKYIYAHLNRLNVSEGDTVRQGDIIGLVGSSGLATGPHLHFEVKQNGRQIDPRSVFNF